MASYPPRFGPRYWPIIHLNGKRLDAMLLSEKRRLAGERVEEDFEEKCADLWHFLHKLDSFLPCNACVVNFLAFRTHQPLPEMDVAEPEAYFHWTVDLHNHANEVTGKAPMSYAEADAVFQKQWMDVAANFELADAQLNRLEDHQRIKELQEEVTHLKEGQRSLDNPTHRALLISLICVACLAAFALAYALYLRRKQN